MNLTEKILARAAGKNRVSPGEFVDAGIDKVLIHDRTGPTGLFRKFEKLKRPVWNREAVAVFVDHAFPPDSLLSAKLVRETYDFVKRHRLPHFYPGMGVCHQLLPEMGHVIPGHVIVGADSHTTTHGAFGAFATGLGATEIAWVLAEGRIWFKVPATLRFDLYGTPRAPVMAKDVILQLLKMTGTAGATYKSLEFTGPYVEQLMMDERMVLTNMALEMGAKSAIIPPDDRTLAYLKDRAAIPGEILTGDPDADYEQRIDVDLSGTEPLAACPHSPDHVKPVTTLRHVAVHQVFIGSCTGGRMNDLRTAARILKGRSVNKDVRVLVTPASKAIYRTALEEGLIALFMEAGATVCNPGCGACAGIHMGIMADGEVCVTTSNRNFPGRMGSLEAGIYLASPATAAATALTGRITSASEFL